MANTQNLDLVKPLGTDHALVSVLNSNSDKIDAYAGAVNAGLDGLRDGLGILADGNTHAAITSGQFVYVKNHQTLPQGLYQATTNIAANGTLSTSNLTADPNGGLNTINEQIGTLDSKLTPQAGTVTEVVTSFQTPYLKKCGNICELRYEINRGYTSDTPTHIATIPTGFRPKTHRVIIPFTVDNGSGTVVGHGISTIALDGKVTISANVVGFVQVHATFIAEQ